MTINKLGKKILKIVAIAAGFLLALLVAFHFWFNAHAKSILEDLVESKSNGTLKLKVEKFRFNYFSRKIELQKAVFYNTDTATGSAAYRFSVEKMYLRARAILPIVFKKKILIDSLTLSNPYIEVTKLRPSPRPGKELRKDVSIPEEMGKVYRSIQDALNVLKVKRFQIDQGTFVLINKMDTDQLPLRINNIHFQVDNLQVDTAQLTGKEKILFSDNVVLRSTYQDILFPDKRHKLSFSHFRINLKNKLVEFDSCTIAAIKTDSAASSFSVFFDRLRLSNINFDTLYRTEVIKADSVYCLNPRFVLEVETGKRKYPTKSPPKLENIIQQLTGNLELGFVVVENAGFDIKTIRDEKPTSYVFSNNSFEMKGLSVDQQAAKPIRVKSFAMAIRNYENFIKDSTYSIQFDSVLFNDDRITLSNFVFHKLDNGKILNTFNIPRFYLGGLSWDALVFDRMLKADQATMFNPYINYTASAKKSGRQNIFQSLGAVNEYMDLQYLDVVEGTINLKLRNNLNVVLEKANLSVQSHELLQSKKVKGIRNSLNKLDFEKGRIHAGNLLIELKNIRYGGDNNRLTASGINIRGKDDRTHAIMEGISAQTLQVDEATGDIYAEGLRWKKADLKITGEGGSRNDNGPVFHLKDVAGENTRLSGSFGAQKISATVRKISFTELQMKEKLQLSGLAADGNHFALNKGSLSFSAEEFIVRDHQPSSVTGAVLRNNTHQTTAHIRIPALSVTPHVQQIINGKIALDDIEITKPVVNILSRTTNSDSVGGGNEIPETEINRVTLIQPRLHFKRINDKDSFSVSWEGEKQQNNGLEASGLKISKNKDPLLSVNEAELQVSDLVWTAPDGKKLSTGEGKLAARLSRVRVASQPGTKTEWEATVSSFRATDFRFDSTGKAKGSLYLKEGTVRNFFLRSSLLGDIKKLVASNQHFEAGQLTGHYHDAIKKIHWYNAGFNRTSNTFTLDSFSFVPAISRDSFIARQSFQSDYMQLRSGAVRIGPVDLDRFIQDTVLRAQTFFADQLVFTSYRDKQLPFNAGIVKPLPVNMIKKIPLPLAIDTILVTRGQVAYTEVGVKTKEPGTIPVTRMTVRVLNFKNVDVRPADSLDIRASGYLMDTAWIALRVRESYTDSLGGFLMTLRLKPADLAILNPALIPLASVKVEKGFLDTLYMRAVGREYLSLGEMKMFYRDLKVRFLKNGDETKKTFLTGLMTFIANSFVVRTHNTSRTGKVFFIRNRDRSAINYLVKIAMSGIASSVGAKSNKKMIRKYRKELEKRNLPPIDFD